MKMVPVVSKWKGTDGKMMEAKGESKDYASWAEIAKDYGEEKAVKRFNAAIKIDRQRELRGGKVLSLSTLIKKASPKAQEEIQALLKKHGLA